MNQQSEAITADSADSPDFQEVMTDWSCLESCLGKVNYVYLKKSGESVLEFHRTIPPTSEFGMNRQGRLNCQGW
jgi:hypothetical protein